MKSPIKALIVFGGGILLFFVLLGIIFSKSSQVTQSPSPSHQIEGAQTLVPSSTPGEAEVKVTRVIDGDTIEIEGGKRVRLIGIDSSEKGDCYSQESTNKAKELLENQSITLEKDVSETDRYGRLLRYIWKGETLINEQLVKEGFASSYSYPPDVKYQDRLVVAQKDARENNQGLWSACSAIPTTTSSTTKPTTSSQTFGNSCKYSCSGPDRDCSDFSTHAEAQVFFECCGFTASYDPMRLDKATGQGNGIACESLP